MSELIFTAQNLRKQYFKIKTLEKCYALDPEGIMEFRELLKKINQERGVMILISSHLLGELHQLAACYGFIHKGKMAEQISAEKLMKCLIKAELFKLKKSLGFKLLLLANVVITLLMAVLYVSVLDSELTGYHILKSSLAMVLYHAYIGYLFAAVFCSSEFSNRTFAMSLLCGSSRTRVFLAKAAGFCLGMTALFVEAAGLETVFFSVSNGFGMALCPETILTVLRLSILGLAGCLTMGAVMLFVTVIFKKAMITFGVGIGCIYAFLHLETMFRDHPLPYMKYAYTYQIRQISFGGDTFSPGLFCAVLAITFTAALAAAVFIFEKSELN